MPVPYVWLCAFSVTLSALLLFSVQPVLAKLILPWFGGTAAVWSVCIFFFQGMLLAGYGYAHLLARYLTPRRQALVHSSLLALSLLALPILPNASWKPAGTEDPLLRILGLLVASIGGPYFLLAATSPLVQSWYARREGGALPYRLFALSNLASLAALLAYPVLIEPRSTAREQATLWTALYILCALALSLTAWLGHAAPSASATTAAATQRTPAPPWRDRLQWLLLSALPSALLLAVTNHLCQNVAAIPFLWLLPLVLYLATFILCFDSERLHRWPFWTFLGAAALAALSWAELQAQLPVRAAIPLFLAGLFAACMYCHSQLAARKPAAEHLTYFYLMISLGGALGSLAVGMLAPRFLRGYFELPLALALCAFTLLFLEYRKHIVADLAYTGVAIAAVVGAGATILSFEGSALASGRNFYGVLRVAPSETPRGPALTLVHGSVNHGSQYVNHPKDTTAYYTPRSGAALALASLHRPSRRIGLIGLGVGVLAAYAKPDDNLRFYEINPLVVDYARTRFRFLSDCPAPYDIVLGDGRMALERERPNHFDLLVVDAFSGDSIPVHLLSREALQLYLTHLQPGGVLAMHVSNLHLRLAPVVEGVGRTLGLHSRLIAAPRNGDPLQSPSEWVLLSRHEEIFSQPALRSTARTLIASTHRPWTDDYNNLLQVLR
ncbi:MAG: fused MFS/spermidine synthase [Bryobacterales bacterium]|nr:fused MFS/spermidine synthase [Bryobacterales bacterium]